MPTYPQGYFDRTQQEDNYDKHLFIAGRVLQSAELNEIQQSAMNRSARLGDALFKDGDVIRDARIVVDADTGQVTCESGAIYLRGAVRGVSPASLLIATNTVVEVGIRLVETVITSNEDANLRDPAAETRNYQERGAARLQVSTAWGFRGDGEVGEFYPVYTVNNGILINKEPPPSIDAISNAIASYDRQSAGGLYVVEGMRVTQLPDNDDGDQVYSVQEGAARVFGRAVEFGASRRVVYPAVPDLGSVDSEPFVSSTVSAQRINVDRTPINDLQQVRITAEKTATIVHGNFSGASDPLPDTSVIEIVSAVQGGTTYVKGTDYKLTSGEVDWSLAGAEPAPGSSYEVTYRYITSVTPTAVDEEGFTVTGAVVGTLVQTTYTWKQPRYDLLCMSQEGEFSWINGSPATKYPQLPKPPSNLLMLAQVLQTWTSDRETRNNGVRTIPMDEIEDVRANVGDLFDLVAQQRLLIDASAREPAAKLGLFVDPFTTDAQRDSGIAQDAVVDAGVLTLPIPASLQAAPNRPSEPVFLANEPAVEIEQASRTGCMKINPYMAFEPLPAPVSITPAVDHFTQVDVDWAPSIFGSRRRVQVTRTSEVLNLRQIAVNFSIQGFGSGETLEIVEFDGVNVTDSVTGA